MKNHFKHSLLIFCVFIFLIAASPVAATGADLLFPLNYSKIVAATFGEYRIGHPHAGMDFSTGLQTGRQVLAASSGDIIRIRASYFGYGRVLYQRTGDGQILVYAHLDGFSKKIDKITKQIQKQNGKYSFNRFFAPGKIPVKRGEIIGYSGESGTDVAHLHFEVRDSNNVTVNPQKNGLSIPDNIPPAIQKLHIEPLEFDAQVNRSWHEKTFAFTQTPEGEYVIEKPILIGGNIGLALKTTDYANNTPRLLNPYRIEFKLNGKTTYVIQYDRFDYQNRSVSELDYIYRLKEQRQGAFHRLYRLYKQTIFHPEKQTGNLKDLAPGQHLATIIVTDNAGNVSKGKFTLNVNQQPTVQSVAIDPRAESVNIRVTAKDPDGQVTRVVVSRMNGAVWEEIPAPALGKGIYEATTSLPTKPTAFRVVAVDNFGDHSTEYLTAFSPDAPIKPKGELNAKPHFSIRNRTVSLLLTRNSGFSYSPQFTVRLNPPAKSGGSLDYVRYQESTAIRINAQIPADWNGGTIIFEGIFKSKQAVPYIGKWELPLQIAKAQGTILGSADGLSKAVFPKGAAYANFPCMVRRKSLRSPNWLEKVSGAYEYSQSWEPLQKKPRISIRLPDNTHRPQEVGLYLYDRGVWWYVGNNRQGQNITGQVAHLGTFALMRDISAPDIGEITPSGVSTTFRPKIQVGVSDAGSGLYGGGIDFRLNGQRKIVEWHPYRKWIRYTPEKPLSVGTHKVTLTMTDRAGNSTTRTGSFTINR